MPQYRRVHFRVSFLMDKSSGTRRARASLEEYLRYGCENAPALMTLTSSPRSLLVTHSREPITWRARFSRLLKRIAG